MNQPAETVKLDAIYTDGLAYFSIGSRKYVKCRDKGLTIANPHHLHPMMTQGRDPNHLAEIGRDFPDIDSAIHYVEALTRFDDVSQLARLASDADLLQDHRRRATLMLESTQSTIKKYYLETLRTIPDFEALEPLLDMDAQIICDSLAEKKTK